MQARRDLGKFITESAAAQRRAVLSSGREADCDVNLGRVVVQRRVTVRRLTPGAGIESLTAMGSDQTAAEALQRQRPKSAFEAMVDRGTYVAARADGMACRSADLSTELGLTA
jgi:hypothetical protein